MSILTVPSFTNIGYWLHSRDHQPLDTDMTGRTVLITGATGGLGRAGAEKLAALGARTLIVGRNAEKLAAASADIGGDVTGYQSDLSLISEIRGLATRILEEENRLDVLINNVGVLLPERQLTEEGLEETFATDLAGHFLLTNLLLVRLIESAPSRVVNITSGGMYSERIRPDDLQFEARDYKGTTAYAHAKRGQVILTEMWAKRLDGTGVSFHAMHPGWAATGGVAASLPTFNTLMRPFLRTAEQGADTMVWLAAATEPAAAKSGELWFDREIVPKHFLARTEETPEDQQRLWDRLVEITGSDLPDLEDGGRR
jgi:dehydrogenase/reductase SDR family member 12